MYRRSLTILAVAVFALTLLFAAAAGAQEAAGSLGGGGIHIQQQQVLNNQQQEIVAVQQQVGVQAQSCPGARTERTVSDPTTKRIIHPDIEGGAVRITYRVDSPGGELDFELRDEDGHIIVSETVRGVTNGTRTIKQSTDPGEHEFTVRADEGLDYFVKLEDCTNVEADDDNDGGDGDGDGDGTGDGDTTGDTTGTDTTTNVAQTPTETTTAQETTTAETTTADDALNADVNRPDAENFQCELFLRVVRDERGALRRQYADDELIVQRFEQCLAADVLADTIPDRRLPFTGGPLLPFGGGLLLLVAAAVLVGRMIRR